MYALNVSGTGGWVGEFTTIRRRIHSVREDAIGLYPHGTCASEGVSPDSSGKFYFSVFQL